MFQIGPKAEYSQGIGLGNLMFEVKFMNLHENSDSHYFYTTNVGL